MWSVQKKRVLEGLSSQAPEYVSPVTVSSTETDVPAQAPRHAPNLPELDKENAPPKDDETPAAEDF
jgi:hypothetical protein